MSELKLLNTKRCTCCSNDSKNCYCHPSKIEKVKCESVRSRNCGEKEVSDIKLSGSLSSEKSEIVKQWLKIKENEKKQLEKTGNFLNNQKNLSEAFAKQRSALLELERKNFRIWLMCKKNEALEAKRREDEMKERREIERRKRQIEAQMSFQEWVRKKEEQKLERQKKQQMRVMNELQMREIQLAKNQHAFNQWLEEAKQRPKPFNNNQTICKVNATTAFSMVASPLSWERRNDSII